MSAFVLRRVLRPNTASAVLVGAESDTPRADDRRYKVLTPQHAPTQLPLFPTAALRPLAPSRPRALERR